MRYFCFLVFSALFFSPAATYAGSWGGGGGQLPARPDLSFAEGGVLKFEITRSGGDPYLGFRLSDIEIYEMTPDKKEITRTVWLTAAKTYYHIREKRMITYGEAIKNFVDVVPAQKLKLNQQYLLAANNEGTPADGWMGTNAGPLAFMLKKKNGVIVIEKSCSAFGLQWCGKYP